MPPVRTPPSWAAAHDHLPPKPPNTHTGTRSPAPAAAAGGRNRPRRGGLQAVRRRAEAWRRSQDSAGFMPLRGGGLGALAAFLRNTAGRIGPQIRVGPIGSAHSAQRRQGRPGLAGSRGRSGRGAPKKNVATPAGSRVARKMTGSLFESKNHHLHHNIGLGHLPSRW